MASATQKTKTVVVEQEVPDGILLHLTDAEAAVLRAILGMGIVGNDSGPRGLSDQIYYALNRLGVRVLPASQIEGRIELKGARP